MSKKLSEIGITYEIKEEDDILLIKINTKNTTFTIIPRYLRPATWQNEFNKLKQSFDEINYINPIVIGDFNVRIGELNQEIVEVYNELFEAGFEIRRSRDKVVNAKGRQFLEFCNDNNLLILNGRTHGDEDGKLTYASTVGESVNDICSVSFEALHCVEEFTVEDKIWSDHYPIKLKLKVGINNGMIRKLNLLPKLYWNNSKKVQYQNKLNANIDNIISEELNLNDMCNIIKRSAPTAAPKFKKFEPKQIWYNYKCNNARTKCFECLKKYRNTRTIEDKEKYLQTQKTYKQLCKSSKINYYKQLINKINNVCDSKQWWKTAKEIRNHKYQIGSEISASTFKSYFQNLLNPPQTALEIQYVPVYTEDNLLDNPINISELKNVLCKVKLNKAPGEDRIPYEFIVNATEKFYNQLLRVYNYIYNSGNIDKCFIKTIVFPIYKKGDSNIPNNYRGISFMNCIVKVMMGVLNERLYNWVENRQILTEYQAGFRRKYSTVDNIYNLSSLVSIKLAEKNKVYAFFIDFKAAFDNVSRKALIYKLFNMGVSYKFVRMIETIYSNTESAVWTGEEISENFKTKSGVKQGCLLSPLLFALYINDLHDYLQGGIFVENLNIRLLLYADDIVLLADKASVLQNMINNLESYCKMWNLEVNLSKSEIVVFRNGGRLGRNERWFFNNAEVKISSEFNYLGVILTPKLKFHQHVERRNTQAKNAINTTWQSFLSKKDISLQMKWKVFLAVCRSIQSYAAQIWGFEYFEQIDKFQRYFLKKILKLPNDTPNYILMLETAAEDNHFYTMGLHLQYICKTLFHYEENRLPNFLSKLLIHRELFWVKNIKDLAVNLNIQWPAENFTEIQWKFFSNNLLSKLKINIYQERMRKKSESVSRMYKYLDIERGHVYLANNSKYDMISWIFKARSGMIRLNGNRYDVDVLMKYCTLCNLHEVESFQHFLGVCPILREFRMRFFQKPILNDEEMVKILNGIEAENWSNLVNFLKISLKYRKFLISEFNT